METRANLLDHAEALTRGRGFDGFSFADLEARVGIRKASIHYHFPTKGDLSFALIDRYTQVFQDRLHGISDTTKTAGQRLLAVIDIYRQALEGGRSLCLCVALSITQSVLPDTTKTALDQFHTVVRSWLEAVFRLGVSDGTITGITDPRAEASAALAQLEGAQVMGRAAHSIIPFEAGISALAKRALYL